MVFQCCLQEWWGGCCAPEDAPPEKGFMDVPGMLALPSGKTHTFYSETNIFGDTLSPFLHTNCFGACWAPHRPTCSFGTSLKRWHQSKKHCMGLKPKLCLYRWTHWLQNYVGFQWKPNPKGFKKHGSVMPLGWGRAAPWEGMSIFWGHQARVDLSHCARRILCKTKWKEAHYILLSEWHQLR